jgi:hypothetical protein
MEARPGGEGAVMLTKNERTAIKADGFVNHYHSPAKIRANREGLRGDIAEATTSATSHPR